MPQRSSDTIPTNESRVTEQADGDLVLLSEAEAALQQVLAGQRLSATALDQLLADQCGSATNGITCIAPQ